MLLLLKRYKIEVFLFLFSLAYFLLFSRYGIDIDDEGFHLYVSNMILKGLIPYRDFAIHASPGSFYLQAFIFKIFSPTIFVGRMSVVVLGLYMTIMLYRISRYIIPSPNFAAIPSILFIFWGVAHFRFPWYGWYGLALALSFAYLGLKYFKTDKGIYLFLAGLFCGLTLFTKQNLGTACFVSYGFFLVIDTVFSKEGIKEKISNILRKGFIFFAGLSLILGTVAFYFYMKESLSQLFYYLFEFSLVTAKGRHIMFNPYPHIKVSSLGILLIPLAFAWLLYGALWSEKKRKNIFLFSSFLFIGLMILGCIFFIIRINEVDEIYIMDHIKTGVINGFFNIATFSMFFSVIICLMRRLKGKYQDRHTRQLLFITLFSILYTWAALCISRDHLHLILGMPPAYILMAFMFYSANQKVRHVLIRKGKDDPRAARFSNQAICILPLIFISYFGFFTSLKNEGFRSISPPLVNMHSGLDVKRGKGIIVTKENKDMIENIVGYIDANTKETERIFDTYRSLLFYFLSDRMTPSFYYYLHPGIFRSDKQEYVIDDIRKHNINLVITEKRSWDDLGWYMDKDNNPLTYKIWRYVADNYRKEKHFGKYYILKRKRM